jgi:AcrR family transcriptional regulator
MERVSMEQTRTVGVTQKAEMTRQRILKTALNLFTTRGYEGTTMRHIAAEAGCSLGLAYRYFSSKEELVLALFRRMAVELETRVKALPRASLADRFRQTILAQFEVATPYRDTLAALFGAALNPKSEAGIFSDNAADIRRQSRNIYIAVVTGATDAPRESQVGNLATALYSMHLALLLFWLQDRSEGTRITLEFLDYLHDMVALVRPLLVLPPASKSLVRLAQIIGPMLGDDSQLPQGTL